MTFSTYFSPGVALQGGGGGAASAPLKGTGATVTTSQPLIDVSQTWNAGGVTFTGWKLNVTDTASATSSLLMDLQVGGVSQFKVEKSAGFSFLAAAGQAYIQTNATVLGLTSAFGTRFQAATARIDWTDGFGNPDLHVGRRGAANLRLGLPDAAAPAAQTLSVQSVVAGTSNTAGPVFKIAGAQSSGDALGGAITLQGSPAGSSGSVVNSLVDIFTAAADGSARIVRALTVATLPATPATGMVARVTDALAPAVGATVAAGGAAQALVWYNGANWSVIGV